MEIGEIDDEVVMILEKAIVVDCSNVPLLEPGYFRRMQEGGIDCSNLTVPDGFENTTFRKVTEKLYDHIQWIDENKETASLATSVSDIKKAKREGRVAIVFGPQWADFVEKIDDLGVFERLGVKVMQLTYNYANRIGDGCGEKRNAGLSKFGENVIEEMNRIGIVIDLSHCGDATTNDAIELSKDPVIFSHANSRNLVNQPRNKTDDQIKAVAEKGGVVGAVPMRALIQSEPYVCPSFKEYYDMIDYLVNLVGVDHVGLSTDICEPSDQSPYGHRFRTPFYMKKGAKLMYGLLRPGSTTNRQGKPFPLILHGFSDFPKIVSGILTRGYSENDMKKILGGNFLRVFKEVWGD